MKIIVCKYTGLASIVNLHYSIAAAVDFWALGVCLFQFLVGRTPFTDDCPRAIISNILNNQLAWPNEDENQLSEDAINVIKGLLNYDPTLRFQLEGNTSIFH